ncbi:hypothetical protein Pogu_2083 [Pyrobaculum oguniense TE7]|uniref:Uncharacterized protein n=1 Tax=Pyrobaculum oguniense (strain DSM 13380 / JCM 10595 / TE7) TaxID=698757 RepID=H6QCR4_PYROT|nr:hypothetical protein Pogu_2083 [Pyrobaculum oguniense TE7]
MYRGVRTKYSQISALVYYLYTKRREKGRVVAVRVVDLCGIDRKCGAEVSKLLGELVKVGVATKHKKGVYLLEKHDLAKALAILRNLV